MKQTNLYNEDVKAALAAFELPWQQLSGKNILVLGATGLIGGCLVDMLMQHRDWIIRFMLRVVTKSGLTGAFRRILIPDIIIFFLLMLRLPCRWISLSIISWMLLAVPVHSFIARILWE